MARKSSIDMRSDAFRQHVFKRLRENRLTLDELRAELEVEFPDEPAPSRSSLGRFAQGFDKMVSHERDMAAAAEALVGELGDGFDSKSGALLAQAVTTLTSRYAMGKLESGDEMDIADVLDLARAAKTAQEARSLNLKERTQVEKLAREKLLEEQKAKLDAMGTKGGVTEETKRAIREALGIV